MTQRDRPPAMDNGVRADPRPEIFLLKDPDVPEDLGGVPETKLYEWTAILQNVASSLLAQLERAKHFHETGRYQGDYGEWKYRTEFKFRSVSAKRRRVRAELARRQGPKVGWREASRKALAAFFRAFAEFEGVPAPLREAAADVVRAFTAAETDNRPETFPG